MKLLHDDLDTSESILFSLAAALEAKDFYTRGHSERVARARRRDRPQARPRPTASWRRCAAAGSSTTSARSASRRSILLKPGRLTDEEMAHIRTHAARGYDICAPLKSLEPLPAIIRSPPRAHGRTRLSRRPARRGRSRCRARIAAVADSYDAMTTDRPYRKGMTVGAGAARSSRTRSTAASGTRVRPRPARGGQTSRGVTPDYRTIGLTDHRTHHHS